MRLPPPASRRAGGAGAGLRGIRRPHFTRNLDWFDDLTLWTSAANSPRQL